MVSCVREGKLAGRRRKRSPLLAAVVAPAAVFFAVGASAHSFPVAAPAEQVADQPAPCCLAIVAAPRPPVQVLRPAGEPDQPAPEEAAQAVSASTVLPASRLRMVSRFLPVGVAPERGLQVRTIQAARSISDAFPQIHQIGGVRADALRWHPNGLALDVMIPNPSSADGIALGDAIVAYALDNAARFGLQDVIWRGVYYTPNGRRSAFSGHYDHVHVTTTGGGYPTGLEGYLR